MKRVLVIGSCGSGKSTFARKLQSEISIPLVHLDQHFFKPGRIEPEKKEWRATVSHLIGKDTWIMDGNYGGTMEMRMERADTIIWLDLPRYICLYRIIKRVFVHRNGGRPDMAEGCDERFDWKFIKYVWNFKKNKNPLLRERIDSLRDGKKVFVLKSSRATVEFLSQGYLRNRIAEEHE
jgi:adenylate kinase family enzyme